MSQFGNTRPPGNAERAKRKVSRQMRRALEDAILRDKQWIESSQPDRDSLLNRYRAKVGPEVSPYTLVSAADVVGVTLPIGVRGTGRMDLKESHRTRRQALIAICAFVQEVGRQLAVLVDPVVGEYHKQLSETNLG